MSFVWRNGQRLPGDAMPGTFPSGACFFETFACHEKSIQCLDDHLARLASGMRHQGLSLGPLASGNRAAWQDALVGLEIHEGILRLVTGADFEELGARALLPSPATFVLRTLRTVRDEAEWLPRPKSAPWTNSLTATMELRALGVAPGTEGVQLDARGNVSEATRSSLAWIMDGELCLPADATGRLMGTAQAQLAACSGLAVKWVVAPPPREAEAVMVLRSTLQGGGAPVTEWQNSEGQTLWRAEDLSLANRLLSQLAAHRAQRSVSLA